MKVFVLGGTGFLGYHATLELVRRGHAVTVVALPPLPAPDLFPPEVGLHLVDVDLLADEDLLALLDGHDAVVFAAGADDRTTPRAPAARFFTARNVDSARRVFTLARRAGVRRGTLLGSYFTHFARQWPEFRLGERHPYIRSRIDQVDAVIAAGGGELAVSILELPYIFGAMPGRMPLWAPLVSYLEGPWPLVFPRGGTNVVAVARVAEAIAGALERAGHGESHLIGDENLTWTDLLTRLQEHTLTGKKVRHLPDSVLRLILAGAGITHRLQGRESGLEPHAFFHLETRETFFDPAASRAALGYGSGGLEEAFRDTVAACHPGC